ncbi:MAG: hypothetical protein C4337_01570 [Armatimonadota bacterium]
MILPTPTPIGVYCTQPMTLTMFGFAVLMVVFGALLAYSADWLGRRLGKQRLSLFGIRPRYTATLLTTLTGGLTVVLTISLLTAVNQSFRVWITRGDRILQELHQNEERLKALQSVNQQLTQERKRLEAERDQITQQRERLRADYAIRLQQVQALSEQLATTQNQLNRTQSQLRQEQRRIASLRNRRAALEAIRLQMERMLQSLKQDIARLQTEQEQLRTQNDRLAQESILFARENTELEKRNQALQTQNNELQTKNQQLVQENRDLEQQNEILLRRNTQYREQLEQLQSSVQELLELANLRLKPVAFLIGEELARRSLRAGLSEVRLRQALQDLLDQADRNVRARGAKAPASRRAVFIPEKRIRFVSGEEVSVGEVQSLETIVSKIRAANEPVVVIAVVLMNTAEGEPVPIEIRIFQNPRIFRAGELVAETTLDCKPDTDVLAQILQFLRTDVRTRAIQAGLIPVQERASEPTTVGETEPKTLTQILQQIRDRKSTRVRLRAYAAQDTYAGDRLQLRFEALPGSKAGHTATLPNQ